MDIRGKKLLILGANAESIPLVRRAKQMGVRTIVTDYTVNAPAKFVADEYYDIDGKDVDAIVNVIKENHIDGVMLGVADSLMRSYVEICKRMKFPCFVSAQSLEFFCNKRVFKEECSKNMSVIKGYFSESHMEQIHTEKLNYPIVIKPAVSRGGKGITLCKRESDLESAFYMAKCNSDNGEVIGEEYIDSCDVVVTFLCANGITHLLAMSDRKLLKEKGKLATVTYSNVFPSQYIKKFKDEYLQKYSCLFERLKIRNGIINIQMFMKDGEFIPYDPDCILNGECGSMLFQKVFGVDIIEYFIRYALTGKADEQKIMNAADTSVGASVWILLKPGIINRIEGKEIIEKKEYVVDSLWRLKEGNEVTEQMYLTEKSTLARIWIIAKDKTQLEKEMAEIRGLIRVMDKDGNNMVEIV